MEERLKAHVIPQESRLIDAIQAIKESRNRCIIVHSGGKVVGVLSEGDVMRALLHGADIHSPVGDWLSHNFKFLPDLDYRDALELMRMYGITLVPVLDDGFSLQDIVTLSDILERVEFSK